MVLTPEVSVVFLNNRQMRYYNRAYRKKDYPTDVLSFPVHEAADGSYYVGDILISAEKAVAQAQDKGHGFMTEIRILVLHGILHLLGFDHEADTGQMTRLEGRLRRRLIREDNF